MRLNIGKEVAALRRMSTQELQDKYAEFFGEEAWTARNRVWLVKRIAWRLQALDEGDLSEHARRRAAELAKDADLRLSPPRPHEPRPAAIVQAGPTRRAAKRDTPAPLSKVRDCSYSLTGANHKPSIAFLLGETCLTRSSSGE
ncbi:MAG TPA: DUF2924 domain-containing protein [Gemmataceae bacterium]|jgi:hypothetical protein